MRGRKTLTLGIGKYYFVIKSVPNNIMIFRKSRDLAVDAFFRYQEMGKEAEWLGKWNGDNFEDNAMPEAEMEISK